MKKIILKIDGMRCGMCETHVCDFIRKNFANYRGYRNSENYRDAYDYQNYFQRSHFLLLLTVFNVYR